tara:strand:- start:59754 stop:60257 length:504 start_codon:yes stop_codon:yes gene_type:complete
MNKVQKIDDQSLKELFDLNYRSLCSYMVQFTKDDQDAKDIAQETFIKFWEKRDKLQITSSFKSYLFRSAYNLYMDQIRKEKRNDLLLVELKYEGLLSQIEEEGSDQEEKINKVKQVVEKLPNKCKEILLLSKREGLKNKEIAIRLNISIKTVESQIRVAFQKIRRDF